MPKYLFRNVCTLIGNIFRDIFLGKSKPWRKQFVVYSDIKVPRKEIILLKSESIGERIYINLIRYFKLQEWILSKIFGSVN